MSPGGTATGEDLADHVGRRGLSGLGPRESLRPRRRLLLRVSQQRVEGSAALARRAKRGARLAKVGRVLLVGRGVRRREWRVPIDPEQLHPALAKATACRRRRPLPPLGAHRRPPACQSRRPLPQPCACLRRPRGGPLESAPRSASWGVLVRIVRHLRVSQAAPEGEQAGRANSSQRQQAARHGHRHGRQHGRQHGRGRLRGRRERGREEEGLAPHVAGGGVGRRHRLDREGLFDEPAVRERGGGRVGGRELERDAEEGG